MELECSYFELLTFDEVKLLRIFFKKGIQLYQSLVGFKKIRVEW